MAPSWPAKQLALIADIAELQIASCRADGTLRRWTPIWVVCVDGQVYVRTWYRRTTGWFGRLLDSGQARVRVPGLETDVVAEDVGDASSELRARVDDAYRNKYGGLAAERMVADPAAATTLRLAPAYRELSPRRPARSPRTSAG